MHPQLLEKWCEHFLLCQVPDSYRYDKVIFTFVSREESVTWSEMCVLCSSLHSHLDHVCMYVSCITASPQVGQDGEKRCIKVPRECL